MGTVMSTMMNDDLMDMFRQFAEKKPARERVETRGFAELFDLSTVMGMEHPVLVTSCYGVGSKIKVALSMNRFDSIGKDCVAVCVNDILCVGAQPLFFTDHIACARNKTEITSQILQGINAGCEEAGALFTGGKISQLSDLYGSDELGIVGFAAGVVDEAEKIDGSTIKPGNSIIGIASSGLHSNGYSAISNVFRNFNEGILNTYFDNIGGTLGDVMLEPVIIYKKAIQSIKNEGIRIRGIAHISDGGFKGNLGHILPEGTSAEISMSSFAHPEIFRMIEETGGFSKDVMYGTFNMGIGMVVVVASQDRDKALQAIRHSGQIAFLIGSIQAGDRDVLLTD